METTTILGDKTVRIWEKNLEGSSELVTLIALSYDG